MALHSVRVPPHLEDLFRNAERIVSDYFSHQKQSPSRGAIEIFDERYLLIRGAALSVEFFEVVRDLFDKDREVS